jgi:DNA repair protein RadC
LREIGGLAFLDRGALFRTASRRVYRLLPKNERLALRRIREVPIFERPRERLAIHGPQALSTSELLTVLFGSRVPADAIATDLTDLARTDLLELTRIPGIGQARAAQLLAAFEIGRRSQVMSRAEKWTIRAPRDVADRLLPEMARLEREELRVLLLNAKNGVIRQSTVYVGNVSAALVRVAELFRDAVRAHAAGLIVVHNHPSGDPEPSPDDLHLTAEAIAAGRLLDLPLLDHVILASDGYVSLRDRGITFDRR